MLSPPYCSPAGLGTMQMYPLPWEALWLTVTPHLSLKCVHQLPLLSSEFSVVLWLLLCLFNHSTKCIKCFSFKNLNWEETHFLCQKWSKIIAVTAFKQIKSVGAGSSYLLQDASGDEGQRHGPAGDRLVLDICSYSLPLVTLWRQGRVTSRAYRPLKLCESSPICTDRTWGWAWGSPALRSQPLFGCSQG